MSTLLLRGRQALAELLSEWELNWLAWPGPGGDFYCAKLLARPVEGWLDAQGDPEQVKSFLHVQDPQQSQPLVVVLEPPTYLDWLERLRDVPWLVVLLLDTSNWLSPVPSGEGWFHRKAEPPAYAWSSWLREYGLDFWGSADLTSAGKQLDELLNGSGRRLLHLHSDHEGAAGPVSAPSRTPSRAGEDSQEGSFLEQLAAQWPADTSLVWASDSEPPRAAARCRPAEACSAAWGIHRAGHFPVVAVPAAELPALLPALFEKGLPPGCLLLTLEAGLCWRGEESRLPAGRLRDLALLRQVHGLALACPADVNDALQLTRLSLSTSNPVALRLTRSPAVQTGFSPSPIQAGKAHCLRQGKQVALLALGHLVYAALLAAEAMAPWGVECQVWDVRFVKPIDREALQQAAACGHLVTVEEHCLQGGLATAVLETLAQLDLHPRTAHLGLPAFPAIEAGAGPEEFELDAEGIQKAVRRLLGLGGHLEEES